MLLVAGFAWPSLAQAPKNIASIPRLPEPREYLRQIAGNDFGILDRIIWCESGYNPRARNRNSTASGLAQFIASTWKHWGQGDVFDPYNNINAMVDLYRAQGTSPWLASRGCWYDKTPK